ARLADVTSLAHVLSRRTTETPTKPGETYRWALEVFVPRALFPEKPNPGTFGNQFGRAYGFIQPVDFQTSVAVTQVGEAYINGGWLVLLIVMPIVGSIYRLLNDYLAVRCEDPIALAVYATSAVSIVIGA